MSCIYLFIVLESLLFSLNFQEYYCQIKSVSACNSVNLEITCLENQKIAIERIFFGARDPSENPDCQAEGSSDPACCRRGHRHCISYNSNTETVVKRLCSGRRECFFPVRAVKTERCRDPSLVKSDYMTVYYNCIPENLIADICSDDLIQAIPPIYLSNEGYPLPRSGSSDCTCMVVKNPNQATITVKAIEISFIDSQCSFSFLVRQADDKQAIFPCNYRLVGYRLWTQITTDNATISLVNENDQGDAYLWLELDTLEESETPISLYCGDALRKLLNPDDSYVTAPNEPDITSMHPTVAVETTTKTKEATTATMTSTVTTSSEEDMITLSGTTNSDSKFKTQIPTMKPRTTHTTTTSTKPRIITTTTSKPETTTTSQSTTTLTTTAFISPTNSTSTLSTPTTTTGASLRPSTTVTTIKPLITTTKPQTTTIKPQITTIKQQITTTTSDLAISQEAVYCYTECRETVGHGFTLNLKSFVNPSKVNKYCRKINDLVSCFESNSAECSSVDKMDADKELRANLAGRQVICEERINEIQYMAECYNMKHFRRDLSLCDQLLYPFDNADMTEKCKLKENLVDCVEDVVEQCNDERAFEFMIDVTRGLFNHLYDTENCSKDSDNGEKETEKPKPETEESGMEEPKPEPDTEEPQPEPVTQEPKPEPETEEPKPEPETEEPKPETDEPDIEKGDKDSSNPNVIPEEKTGSGPENAGSVVRGVSYCFHIILIALLMIVLS